MLVHTCHVSRVQAVVNVDDYGASAQALAATTLRNVLGTRSLGEILSDRVQIASEIYEMLVEGTQGREGEFSNADFGVHRHTEYLVVLSCFVENAFTLSEIGMPVCKAFTDGSLAKIFSLAFTKF